MTKLGVLVAVIMRAQVVASGETGRQVGLDARSVKQTQLPTET
jgi:hypothetical protein